MKQIMPVTCIAILTCLNLVFSIGPTAHRNTPDRDKAKLYLLDDFENSERWQVETTGVNYLTRIMKVVGCPNELRVKQNDKGEFTKAEDDFLKGRKYVLAVKTELRPQRSAQLLIKPEKPIKLAGYTFEITIWVLGRNIGHKLYVDVVDYHGNVHSLLFKKLQAPDPNVTRVKRKDDGTPVRDKDGKIVRVPVMRNYHTLRFKGWKKLKAVIPKFISQSAQYSGGSKNLWIRSLRIVQNPNEIAGVYHVYLDELEALIQRREVLTPTDDISDTWAK